MSRISTREKILGIILILIILTSVSVLFYIGYLNVESKFTLTNKYPSVQLEYPINPIYPNDGSGNLFVLQHKGQVKIISKGGSDVTTALDLGARSNFHWDWEGGLLGLTFDPNFASNHYLYLFYTVNDNRNSTTDGCDPCVTSTMSRFTYDPANKQILNNTELKILQIPQFVSWHRSGQLNFGPHDGMLYVDVGDSLRGGDTLTNFYGKILRINVTDSTPQQPYTIPIDNPFYNNSKGIKQEIYAYGFRNPWRSSFDAVTNTFWAGDVGKDTWEEIDRVYPGANYGWNYTEGFECMKPGMCNWTAYQLPMIAYPHEPTGDLNKPSGLAVIGGYIYRGTKFPSLVGKYVFGDYTGAIWALTFNSNYTEVTHIKFLARLPVLMSSIGVDLKGELVFAGHAGGKLYQLETYSDILFYIILSTLLVLMSATLISYGSFKLAARRRKEIFKARESIKNISWRGVIIINLGLIGYLIYFSIMLTLYGLSIPST